MMIKMMVHSRSEVSGPIASCTDYNMIISPEILVSDSVFTNIEKLSTVFTSFTVLANIIVLGSVLLLSL